MKSRYNPVLLAVILVGLVCSLWLNWNRHTIEQRNDTVEMAMEYGHIRRLAALEGKDEKVVLQQFKDAGITSLMLFDNNLQRLRDDGALKVVTGSELTQALNLGPVMGDFEALGQGYPIKINAVYVAEAKNSVIFQEAIADMELRVGKERITLVNQDPPIYEIVGSTELLPEGRYDEPRGLLQIPLGLSSVDLQTVDKAGFKAIVRPQNYVNVREDQLDSIFARIKASGVKVSAYMPCGQEVVSYPNKIEYFGKKMQENNMKLVMLEHYSQLMFVPINGLTDLAAAVDYKAARSYVIDSVEQKKISVGTALHRWALTDEERNIRVNYIRPFVLPVEGKDILSVNLEYVANITKNVKARGYKLGEAGVFSANKDSFASYFVGKLFYLPLAAAIIAGAVLYLSLLFNLSGSKELALWAILTAGACGVLMLGRGLLTRQLLAFTAASVFPVLSMSFIFTLWDKHKGDAGVVKIAFAGIWQLALAVALSLVGASFLSAILADSRFLLEMDIYRGVKLTFIMPVVLTAILFAKKTDLLDVIGKGWGTLWNRINDVLSTSLNYKHLVLLFFLLFVAYMFVGRSGHGGGVPVPAIELKMRAFLEQVMYARPREKEFMIGHPLFFLAVMAAYRKAPKLLQFALVCGAVIGQGSLVQTFCHMRTPVVMSFVRALDGYAVGIVFGVVGVLLMGMLLPCLEQLKRRYQKYE